MKQKQTFFIVFVVGVIGFCLGYSNPLSSDEKVTTIVAQRFVLNDKAGNYVGEFSVAPNGTPLLILSRGRKEINTDSDIPESAAGIYLFDGAGELRALMQIGHRGDGNIQVGQASKFSTIGEGFFGVYDNSIRTWFEPKEER